MKAQSSAQRLNQARKAKRGSQPDVRSLIARTGAHLSQRKRGRSPVLRGSRHASEADWRKWRQQNVFSAAEKRIRLEELSRWSDEQRKPGRAWGPLTPKRMRIMEYFHNRRCFTTGALDPAYIEISKNLRSGACAQTISDAIKVFEDEQLIEKQRRTIPVEDPEPGGQTQTQITNAYFLTLPEVVAKRVAKRLRQEGLGAKIKPEPREPNEREAKAMADLMTAPPGETPEERARREHRLDTSIRQSNARANAGLLDECDSTP